MASLRFDHSQERSDAVTSQADIRRSVTDQILRALKNGGLPPWRKPYSDDPNAPGQHTSLSTGSPYRGVNQIILQCSAMRSGRFKSKWWGTYNQIKQNGAYVRRGQKGTRILLWKPIQRRRVNEDGKEIDENFLIMREFVVFNVEQTIDLKQFQVGFTKPQGQSVERYEHADRVIEATGARIEYGGNLPCYRPHKDLIELPFMHQFATREEFYETTFHEAIHWAHNKTGGSCPNESHKKEFDELVAEIGACFLMSELGLPTGDTFQNSAAYLKSWLRAMANDTRYIFTASAQASKAVDYVLAFSRQPVEETEAPF